MPPSVPSGRMSTSRPARGGARRGVARARRDRRATLTAVVAPVTSSRVPHWPQKVNSVGHQRCRRSGTVAPRVKRPLAPASSPGDGGMPSAGTGCRCASESRRSRMSHSARRRASSSPLRVQLFDALGRRASRRMRDVDAGLDARRRCELLTELAAAAETELVVVLVVPPARLADGHQVISTRRSCWPRKT